MRPNYSPVASSSEMWIGSPGSAPADEVHDPDDLSEPPVQQRLQKINGNYKWIASKLSRLAPNKGPEFSDEIPAGSLPRSLDVIVRDEMVEQVKAGDKIVATGCPCVVPTMLGVGSERRKCCCWSPEQHGPGRYRCAIGGGYAGNDVQDAVLGVGSSARRKPDGSGRRMTMKPTMLSGSSRVREAHWMASRTS